MKSKSKSFNPRDPSKGFNPKHWLIDSACSHHISPRKDLFIEGSLKACNVEVTVANGDAEVAKSSGDVRIPWSYQGVPRTSILRDVYHVPGINSNLVSLGQFDTNGGVFRKVPRVGMRLENSKGELFLDAVKKDNLYRVKIRKESASTAKARSNPMFTKSQRLHARLGHPGRNRLSDFEKMVNGIEEGSLKDRFCEHCEIGKSHRRPSKIPMRAVSALLECLHIDVYGPTEKSILGNRYMMTITDQHSKMIWVFFAKDKKGFIEMFEAWLIAREHECAHRHNNERLQRIRLDRGREIWNNKLIRLGEKRGFHVEPTVGYNPGANGMSEIANKIIMLRANVMRQSAGLGDEFWDLSAETACYLRNRGPVSKRDISPWEIWNKERPGVQGLRIFGCPAYVHIPKETRKNKLDVRAWKGVFVGYDPLTEKIWKVLDVKMKTVHRVAHLVWDEDFTNRTFDQLFGGDEHESDKGEGEQKEVRSDTTNGEETDSEAESDNRDRGLIPISRKDTIVEGLAASDSNANDHAPDPHDRGEGLSSRVVGSGRFEDVTNEENDVHQNFDEENFTLGQSDGKSDVLDCIEVLMPGEDSSSAGTLGIQNTLSPHLENQLTLADLDQMTLSDLNKFLESNAAEDTPKTTLRKIRATIKKLEKQQFNKERQDREEQRGDKRNPRRGTRDVAFRVTLRHPGMIDIPLTVEDALDLSNPYCKEWAEALGMEVKGIIDRKTLSGECELPDGLSIKHLVTAKVVFDVKYGENMEVLKFKARFVARGFSQQYGVNYEDTFAPTMGMNALRLLVALAAKEGWLLHQMDVVAAFLAGDLTEDVYMKVPEYFHGKFGKQVKVLKSLYGLKQAARVWFLLLKKTLEKMGFASPRTDESVMVNEKTRIVVVFHVDDLLIAGKDLKTIEAFKKEISSYFEMKDLGEARTVVGVRILHHPNGDISIDQTSYAREIVNEFLYDSTKLYTTPMDPKAASDLVTNPGKLCAHEERAKYLRLLGKLMWMCNTRPDIAFAVNKLASFSSEIACSTNHWKALLRVLSYVSGTLEYGIIYRHGDKLTPPEVARTEYYTVDHGLEIHSGTASVKDAQTFSDADYATDPRDRKSVTGRISLVSGGAVTWASTKQKSVAKSTTQAEYVGLSDAAREALWLRDMIAFLRCSERKEKKIVPMIFGDNEASIQLARGLSNTGKIKHVDTAFHHILDETREGNLKIFWVPGKHMLADGLTKPLPAFSFIEKRAEVGMAPIKGR